MNRALRLAAVFSHLYGYIVAHVLLTNAISDAIVSVCVCHALY
jgi:hypothetical protein